MATAIEALERLSEDPEAQRLAREREDSVRLYQMSLAHSHREGRTEGRTEGRAEGRAAALRATIERLAASSGIQPTAEQRATLEDPKTDLDAILETLISERRWP
jgi:predicted transposase YdaD